MTAFYCDLLSLILLGVGAFYVLSAAIGLVRFPDSLSRVHAVTKPQTVGLILTVIAAIIRIVGSPSFTISQRGDLGILILLVLFTLMTSPVTGQRLGRVIRREKLYSKPGHLSRNEADSLHN